MMSSWIYRQPIDDQLTAWLEVRAFADGTLDVLPWVENGHLKTPGATSKKSIYTFTLNGQQQFSAMIDLPSHCRTVLTGPEITAPAATLDVAYLQKTRLVPAYYPVTPTGATWLRQVQTYVPLQVGNHSPGMGMAGYHESIGLIPEWDVTYVMTGDPRGYKAVVANAYGNGRYAIHHRDEATRKPISFADHPHLVCSDTPAANISDIGESTTGDVTAPATGTAAANFHQSHHHSMGYVAYLITGRFYFLEEVQFCAAINYLMSSDSPSFRDGAKGLHKCNQRQVRGAAWAIRTLAQAASATPDDDPLRAQYLASLDANASMYHHRYVEVPNNPFGWVENYGEYTGINPNSIVDGHYWDAPWMQDFFTGAIGYTLSLDLIAPTKLAPFFVWKAQSIIGRLGPLNEWPYRDPAVYTCPVATSDTPVFSGDVIQPTGPWMPSWTAIYDLAIQGADNKNHPSSHGPGPLVSFGSGEGAWGNLMPAIAYAVEHKVPGAAEGFDRVRSASNWSFSMFADTPVWGVVAPGVADARTRTATAGLPAPGELKNISGMIVQNLASVRAPGYSWSTSRTFIDFSGGVFNPYWGANGAFMFTGGGHSATNDNSVFVLDLNDWKFKRITDPPPLTEGFTETSSVACSSDWGEYADGQPGAFHSYDGLEVLPPNADAPYGRLITIYRSAMTVASSPGAVTAPHVLKLNGGVVKWERAGSLGQGAAYGQPIAYDSLRNRVWWAGDGNSGNTVIRWFDVASGTYGSQPCGGTLGGNVDASIMRYDPQRDRLVQTISSSTSNVIYVYTMDCANPGAWELAPLTMTSLYGCSTPFAFAKGKYYFLPRADTANIYEVDPDTWALAKRPFVGITTMPGMYVAGKKFDFVPALNCFIYYVAGPSANQPAGSPGGYSGDTLGSDPVYAYRPV